MKETLDYRYDGIYVCFKLRIRLWIYNLYVLNYEFVILRCELCVWNCEVTV